LPKAEKLGYLFSPLYILAPALERRLHPIYNREVNLLKILLLAAFLNGLSWIIIVPIWQYPDEQSHFGQIQYRAEKNGIPQSNTSYDTSYEVDLAEKVMGTQRDEGGNNKYTYHPEYKQPFSQNLSGPQEITIKNLPPQARSQMVKREATLNPPLYYLAGAVVYKAFSASDLFTRVFAIRIMSLVIFMGTVVISFKIGQLIFKEKVLQLALPTVIAFKPMLVFASTGILSDTLTIFMFSLFTLFSLKIIVHGFSVKNALFILVSIILGAMTRQNFLVVLFILPLLFIHQLLFAKKIRKPLIIAAIAGVAILYLASYFVPALDFIRRFDYPESSGYDPLNPLYHLNFLEHLKWTLNHTFREVWPWYWGIYKWLSLSLPHIIYQVINRLTILSAIGLILGGVNVIRKRQFKKEMPLLFVIAISFIYFAMITAFDFLFRKNNGYSFGIQGRYFFPAIVSQMAILLTGFWILFTIILRKYAKVGIAAIIILFFVFNFVSQFVVASSYYDTTNLQTFIIQASQYKPGIFKGNIIIFILASSIILQLIFLFKYLAYIIKENESH